MENTKPDLIDDMFQILRTSFFDDDLYPIPFSIREKKNTQDDPLDEYLSELIRKKAVNFQCEKASGPLISPDFVIFRKELCERKDGLELENDLTKIVAIEVKKLERTSQGGVARASGLDYNTTPPCGTVIVYDKENNKLKIHSFYLFICLERETDKKDIYMVTSLVLCDGDTINEDFKLYESIVGERKKQINLGTYRDGANRARPMMIFPNPMGVPEFSKTCILIHPSQNLETSSKNLALGYKLTRKIADKENKFYCYFLKKDLPKSHVVRNLLNPFPTPTREEKTSPRGKFKLSFTIKT